MKKLSIICIMAMCLLSGCKGDSKSGDVSSTEKTSETKAVVSDVTETTDLTDAAEATESISETVKTADKDKSEASKAVESGKTEPATMREAEKELTTSEEAENDSEPETVEAAEESTEEQTERGNISGQINNEELPVMTPDNTTPAKSTAAADNGEIVSAKKTTVKQTEAEEELDRTETTVTEESKSDVIELPFVPVH